VKIWIDGQLYQTESKYRGIGQYVTELLKAIKKNYENVEFCISFNARFPDEALLAKKYVADFIPEENIFYWESVARSSYERIEDIMEFNKALLAYHIACISPDIAWAISPFEGAHIAEGPTSLSQNFDYDFTLCSIFYDAIPYRYKNKYLPKEDEYKEYMRILNSYKSHDHIFCISDFAEKEIKEILSVTSSSAIYAGVAQYFLDGIKEYKISNNNIIPKLTTKNTLLYVGGFDLRKNVPFLIEAFSQTPKAFQEKTSLVIAGYGAPQSLIDLWRTYKLPEENLVITGYVDNNELLNLYKEADLLLQPSFMEGFGLTALEALACGTPSVVSNAGALPEILNYKPAQFNPFKPKELAELMVKINNNPDFSKNIIKQGKKSLKLYTWDKTAKRVMLKFKELLENKNKRKFFNKRNINKVARDSFKNLKLPSKLMARALANSTPSKASFSKKLYIETTAITEFNNKSGIQRVVENICINATQNDYFGRKSVIVNCDPELGFYSISTKKKGNNLIFKTATDEMNSLVEFTHNDTLLLLDSSWIILPKSLSKIKGARLKGSNVISVLYDLIPMMTPGFCTEAVRVAWVKWFTNALEYSSSFVCISQSVADELYEFLQAVNYPRKIKINYWHLGSDFKSNLIGPIKTKKIQTNSNDFKSFLSVGTLEPRKGYKLIIEAFERLWCQGFNCRLTILGRPGWKSEDLVKKIKNHDEFGQKLFWLEDANDKTLLKTYELADAIICASYAEGFGLPIVEAAKFKKSIIASDIPVFREVASNTDVSFFEVGSSKSLSLKIKEFLGRSDNFLSEKTFCYPNWEESTNQLCDVILNDQYYKTYKPRSLTEDIYKGSEIFSQRMLVRSEKSKLYEITLIGEPFQSSNKSKYEVNFSIRNLSNDPWSSVSKNPNYGGINIGCRQVNESGQPMDYNDNRLHIPLMLIPNKDYYFSMTFPKKEYLLGTSFIIEPLQEGNEWFGNGVVVNKQKFKK
jgi:glycosyltransferase involved in cell wall biosynthesis